MNRKARFGFLARVLICVTVISALIIYFAQKTIPDVSLVTVFAWLTAAVLLALTAIALGFHVTMRWHTWCLNRGATDPQWMWFGGEPPGLQRLRRDAKAKRDEDHSSR
ncbi:hypothetical protein D3871_12880 [Noviherbaspirillum saxi]|uniref:Uncharacterized protein n=2 Tax=Noviherbaspirillum saxi TaxID=2320863 RepID=A0A3A3FU48_9BURK|nr:hypothetical protein D3871_12880 [Noviherbaspirillum saxi]